MARKPLPFERSAKDRKSDRAGGQGGGLKEGSPAEEALDKKQAAKPQRTFFGKGKRGK